jgi:hypothetical protein
MVTNLVIIIVIFWLKPLKNLKYLTFLFDQAKITGAVLPKNGFN